MNGLHAHWRGWPLLTNAIKVEEYGDDDGFHVIRAELPGIDPATDLSVMVADGEVTIEVRRPQPVPAREESEFRYGRQTRTILLPRGAKDETAVATYGNDGILEVRVRMTRPATIGREVPVRILRR